MAFQKGQSPPKKGEKVVKNLHTDNFDIGEAPQRIQGDGTLATSITVEPVDGGLDTEYADALAFMEEPVEIMVQEVADPFAEDPVMVGNNGQLEIFKRGVPKVTKRKFVDCLIAKSFMVSTPEVQTPNGERTRTVKVTSALKFPFQIIQDKNPKGVEWLRRRLADQV